MPVEIELVREVRRRILKCHAEISELDSARRKRASAALERAKRFLSLGKRDEALRILFELVSRAHENGLGWMFSDASGKAPLHVRAWEILIACLGEGKEAGAAKAIAGLAVKESKHLNEGIVALKGGSYSKAAREFYAAERAGLRYAAAVRKLAGKGVKKPVTALIYLGYAHMLANDGAGAMRKFDAALKLDPENAEALGAKCSLLDLRGRSSEAAKCYARMKEIVASAREA